MKIRVGVIFGGKSVEHEISIISAITAMYKIDEEKYDIVPIYIAKDGEWYTGEILRDIESFKDMDLIGIPNRIVVGKRASEGIIEFKKRNSSDIVECNIDELKEKYI